MPHTGRTALYRLYDNNGELLYVGITNKPNHRFGQHRRTKPWWPRVARKELKWFSTTEDASKAEKKAITEEEPRYNLSANALKITRKTPDKPRISYKDIADDLRRAILDGQFAPGARLPGQHQLMREYGVAESTVRQAFSTLAAEQLITSRQGAGRFVRDLDANLTISVAVDEPHKAADLLARYMSPSNFATLVAAVNAKLEPDSRSPRRTYPE